MLVDRRTAIGLGLLLAAPLLARPVAAAGCAFADLAKGVIFQRQDGSRGLARADSDGTVVIDYVTNRGAWTDQRRVKDGIFEISRVVEESEEPVVGASAPSYSWSYSPRPPRPVDGMSWTGKVRERVEVTLSDAAGTVQRQKTRWTANFRVFDPRAVKLSGCSYQALAVEAHFVGEQGARSQRWVYFPDLGFGIETRRDGKENGIVKMGPA
ncbi:MAG: hypothetical protein IAE87_17975 [Rhodobacteraceae bacterium]|jgi:hypothetical protein|nr:hypothetical protein [Paracoccaceae bacterium]